MRTCIVCGEGKVLPFVDADIKVGILELYSDVNICEECYENTPPSVLEEILEANKKELPF